MTNLDTTGGAAAPRAPWHFWLAAGLLLLGVAIGACDYVLTKLESDFYLSMMTPEQAAYFTDMALWQNVVWALGVWLGVLAAILFVLRIGLAAAALTVSFLCTAGFTIYCVALPAPGMDEPMSVAATGIALLISLFFVLYAWAMKRRGVLR